MATKGLWNIFGVNLPDFGLTEKLGIGDRNAAVNSSYNQLNYNNPVNNAYQAQSPNIFSKTPIGPTKPQTLNTAPIGPTRPQVLSASTGPTNVNQNLSNPFQSQADAEYARTQSELDSALAEYDRQEEMLNSQKAENEAEKNRQIQAAQTEYGKAEKSAQNLISEAGESKTNEENKSLTTAQDTVRKNRNVLRALGILSSSAAGEMLSRPMEAHAQNVADLGQLYIKRKQQVEEWLTGKSDEMNTYKQNLEAQYTQVINNIQQDVRFNRERKMEALQAAQTAFGERMGELNTASQNYQVAAKQYQDNLSMQLAQIALYQNPSANISGITSTLMQPAQPQRNVSTPALTPTEEYRKKLGLLSG